MKPEPVMRFSGADAVDKAIKYLFNCEEWDADDVHNRLSKWAEETDYWAEQMSMFIAPDGGLRAELEAMQAENGGIIDLTPAKLKFGEPRPLLATLEPNLGARMEATAKLFEASKRRAALTLPGWEAM